MPRFNILYLTEIYYDNNKTDSRMLILYDIVNSKYYYYGTRSRSIGDESLEDDFFIEFSGTYHEAKVKTLVCFLKYLTSFFVNKFNIEMHNIELCEDEYDELTFSKVFGKLSKYTELFAYDDLQETEESILEKLDMLTTQID
jgi:hypothetical protein